MTYHAGLGPNLERIFGAAREPHITCDSCGAKKSGLLKSGYGYAAWLRNGTNAPGWSLLRPREGVRIDTCPDCRAKLTAAAHREDTVRCPWDPTHTATRHVEQMKRYARESTLCLTCKLMSKTKRVDGKGDATGGGTDG